MFLPFCKNRSPGNSGFLTSWIGNLFEEAKAKNKASPAVLQNCIGEALDKELSFVTSIQQLEDEIQLPSEIIAREILKIGISVRAIIIIIINKSQFSIYVIGCKQHQRCRYRIGCDMMQIYYRLLDTQWII